MNNLKVFVLMAGLTALLVALGGVFAGQGGAVVMLLVAAALNFFMYFSSSSMVLRAYRARVVTREEAPEVYAIVDRLRQKAGLPMPTIAIAPQEQPNAFATGRNAEHAVVCVTQGILGVITPDELEAVLGHELAHIIDHDMLLMTIAATLAGAISNLGTLAQWGLMFGGVGGRDDDRGSPVSGLLLAILAPIAAMLLQLAISRQREYKADAVGSKLSGKPLELASALRKLDAYAHRVPMRVSPAAAQLAIVNPLAAFRGGLASLFSTHPPTAERIQRLDVLAVEMHETGAA